MKDLLRSLDWKVVMIGFIHGVLCGLLNVSIMDGPRGMFIQTSTLILILVFYYAMGLDKLDPKI